MAKKKILGYVQAPVLPSSKKETKHPRPYTPKEGYTGSNRFHFYEDGTVTSGQYNWDKDKPNRPEE